MTIIATLITRRATVHASDSLLTISRNGMADAINWEQTKIIGVPAWRGAMSYWGLAEVRDQNDVVLWSVLGWLRHQAGSASTFASAEAFAAHLANTLESELSRFTFANPRDKGIGIHFTAYERIQDRWVPEMFLVSNWGDLGYMTLRNIGVGYSRETYGTLSGHGSSKEDGALERRLEAANCITNGQWLHYNNGDPLLYNPVANTILDMMAAMARRGILRDTDNVETLISLGRRPIEVVSALQKDFCALGTRIIGGRIHDLAVTPDGQYLSTSGDTP